MKNGRKLIPIWVLAFLLAPVARAADQNKGDAADRLYNMEGPAPYVMVHYMDWFSLDVGGKHWDHWSRGGAHGHDPTQRRSDGLRDVASVLYPLIGPYDSSSRNVVRYHLATMHAAGASGIIIDWYGKGSPSDACLPVILDEADKLGMKVALCYEERLATRGATNRDQVVENVARELTYVVKQWGSHPAYLRRKGEPWIMQFNSSGQGPAGSKSISPDEFKAAFAKLPEKVCYCRENLNEKYYPPLEGAYIWGPRDTEGNSILKFAADASKLRDQGKLQFFMSRLTVGFNDTGVWGWGEGPRVTKDYGLDVLRRAESQCLTDGPELIQCITWNDFNEGTCFEPTLQTGFAFIDEVEKFIGKLHGRPVNLEDNRKPYEDYVRTCSDRERQELPKVDEKLLQPQ